MTNQSQRNMEEKRTEANIILKVVDQYIKAGMLDEAKDHLDKARIIDPSNAYIYAFEERIAFLKEEAKKKNTAALNRSAMEEAARAKLEEERKRIDAERIRKEAEIQKKRETELPLKKAEQPSVKEENVVTSTIAKTVTEVKNKISAKQADTKDTVNTQPLPEVTTKPIVSPKATEESLDMYKRVLMLAWADGAVSPEEQSQLRDLRTSLHITTEQHTKLEQEVKEESYAHAFTLVWTSGMTSKERTAVINELRQKYQISSEAHSRIESTVLKEFGEKPDRPLIYIIDDEEETLDMIVRVLEGAGFLVKAFATSDEALVSLKRENPDLIIADINLETSTIGGFSFYEKVRQLPQLNLVPFIFLSGLTDEGMIRYGKGLGADDYITKPFSSDMLVDTVKGKLKRYKQMKRN